MAAAVLLPASLVVFNAERFLLAEADGIHAIGGDAERYEIFFHGGGATVAEAEVVFGRAALVKIGRASCRERALWQGTARCSARRHTSSKRDWSSDVCSSDLNGRGGSAASKSRCVQCRMVSPCRS